MRTACTSHLTLAGDIARQEKPQESLGHRLTTFDIRWQHLLALGDGQPTEANALGVGQETTSGQELRDKWRKSASSACAISPVLAT